MLFIIFKICYFSFEWLCWDTNVTNTITKYTIDPTLQLRHLCRLIDNKILVYELWGRKTQLR